MADNEKHVSERGHSRGKVIARRFLRRKLAVAGISVVLLLALVAIFVPMVWPYSYGQITPDLSQPPSWTHPMGTDTLGREVVAPSLRGLQQSLVIAPTAAALACCCGA